MLFIHFQTEVSCVKSEKKQKKTNVNYLTRLLTHMLALKLLWSFCMHFYSSSQCATMKIDINRHAQTCIIADIHRRCQHREEARHTLLNAVWISLSVDFSIQFEQLVFGHCVPSLVHKAFLDINSCSAILLSPQSTLAFSLHLCTVRYSCMNTVILQKISLPTFQSYWLTLPTTEKLLICRISCAACVWECSEK